MNTKYNWQRIPAGGFFLETTGGQFEVRLKMNPERKRTEWRLTGPTGFNFQGMHWRSAQLACRFAEGCMLQGNPAFPAEVEGSLRALLGER